MNLCRAVAAEGCGSAEAKVGDSGKEDMRIASSVFCLASVAVLLAACSFLSGWGDDHVVLNDLVLLEESNEWALSIESPAIEVDCSWDCQRVIRALGFTVNAEFASVQASVLERLDAEWNIVIDENSPDETLLIFDGDIDTSTGEAFLWATFNEEAGTFSLVVSSSRDG